MTREILFRGMSVYDNKWVYGSLIEQDIGGARYYLICSSNQMPEDGELVNFATIGQDTGLLDKKGNKIWEGDIVLTSEGSMHEIVFGKIGFDYRWNGLTGFALKRLNEYGFQEIYCTDHPETLEVIATIYDDRSPLDIAQEES